MCRRRQGGGSNSSVSPARCSGSGRNSLGMPVPLFSSLQPTLRMRAANGLSDRRGLRCKPHRSRYFGLFRKGYAFHRRPMVRPRMSPKRCFTTYSERQSPLRMPARSVDCRLVGYRSPTGAGAIGLVIWGLAMAARAFASGKLEPRPHRRSQGGSLAAGFRETR